ncbi:MAG: S41 family peptidase [Planctomycetota bacterium]|jgi:carboxyl-terminal processing protease
MQNDNSESRNHESNGLRFKILSFNIVLGWLLLVVFSASSYGLAARPAPVEPPETKSTESVVDDIQRTETDAPSTGGAPKTESAESSVVKRSCALICEGKFDEAGELIESVPSLYDTSLHRVLSIVHEYRAMNQQREAARKAVYEEQLAELEKFRSTADANDVNDGNNITKVLAVVNKASEFADQEQKGELLSNPFVERVFQEAKDKAAKFESEGKWLDAYIACYSWLQSIEPNNRAYSDYAEQLIEKANIVASFRDSPCESRKDRYARVEKQMFIRAINALNFNYVNIIDYRQMAAKAVSRCGLLAQVITFLDQDSEVSFRSPDSRELAAWSTALAAILDEVDQSPAGSISRDKFIEILDKLLALNATTIELPEQVLIAQFAEAALSSLDAYTVMVWPRQVQDFEKTMTNEFTGIGIEITKQKGLLTVASLLPDTPAYCSGLDAGDVIEAVDGIQTKDMSLSCAVRKITGPAGTEVALTIRRSGEEETRDIHITRAKITVPTLRGWRRTQGGDWQYMIDDENKIGYVRLTSFSAGTASDLEEVLSELEAEGLKGLILDLRFNSGGLLDSAVEVTDKFIEEGPIVATRPRYAVSSNYLSAHKAGTHPGYPLVVLVNHYSASASEIVSGALQDKAYRRAVIVGERTVGKGSVQGITPYPGGGAQLKYTMAYYHLPSGQRVESHKAMKEQGRKDWGIGPDVEVELRSDELRRMIGVQRENDVLIQANSADRHKSLKKHTLEESLAADPQLTVGIFVVKTKLIQEEASS